MPRPSPSSVKGFRCAPVNAYPAPLTARTARCQPPARKGICFFAQQSAAAQLTKAENTKERTIQTETVELYFQQGSSDKVYHLQLENVQDQWSVNAQWGRRGSALQSDTKVSSVAYAEAKRVYDRILREKMSKGYRVAQATANGDTVISVGPPSVKEHSGHAPELLTPIEEGEALQLVQDRYWWFQQKFDGRRLRHRA